MNEPPTPASHSQTSSFWTGKLFRFLVVAIVLICSISIFAFRERFAEWAAFGYSGIFLVSLLSSATIVLPAPSLALVFAMGSALPWLPVGLAAGAGEALGELTGYLAGVGGRAVIEEQKGYESLAAWMQKRGGITIFALSVIPNPLFDVAGIAAGTLRYPVWRFLLFAWLGKTLKTSLVAWAGSQSITLVEQLLR
ncbi:MAG TPA: VTT domain-containing protein [Anaerolineae bacterium]|nr:VTT domain-containing protein [Anaerolineae bacterium]